MKNIAILLAAGSGSRMQMLEKKQFAKILGKPVIYYSLAAFEASPCIDQVIIVAEKEFFSFIKEQIIFKYNFKKVVMLTEGGKERFHSVWNGLQLLKDQSGYVFIHDSARPMIDEDIIRRNLEAVKEHGACVTGMPAKDTLKISDSDGFVESTPDRSHLWTIQTPQTFAVEIAYQAFNKLMESDATGITDDAMVVERMLGKPVKLVEGSYENIKITTSEDMLVARCFLENRELCEMEE
ncbi:2-C-methyl-D-erythritol 4-phosphate cytidylyltransferase [Lachnospiraceae bacterium PF1-21]|uniref:2-C-methyl-D-erythritol 4-phosphate cytidylyltransferase n=2 Tax=Ohessyouella blattaphilus TaxID=2949333 RepID=A0ABT1ELN3_9FIRM|nr:2-C-methyl-D-erythritol 4-phosphate cytidylyltransferase [Ohessyouella blattaphilus]MCP1111605.1 2-C-methyl-D-erythritol 4-phosphate cytidylyltransferase [Ohessyouella blattaphilus]MCR8564999.1 2-C-methyl-D-erythritol 4-phosphate cytidylyltransferase [Ohessyouella blattaphilus]